MRFAASWLVACAKILASTDGATRFIPGHGPLATRDDLQKYHDMLATVRRRVADLIRRGRTQEQALAAAPTRDLDERYGHGILTPDQWVQRVYVDLRRALKKKGKQP
ncbi:MAG: hypothetical protein WCE48_12055 [Steroidobacteraceae bacterium]